ncbi:AAA family ATPase [Bosea sp. ASV33]|uniref:AAA family ATPase n=1 Tax=Bosea sp. ASV33 TaxID=2795106 RepID=UPI0018EB1D61|nr:AAA family ATPase [Bosea sp. ASV33]
MTTDAQLPDELLIEDDKEIAVRASAHLPLLMLDDAMPRMLIKDVHRRRSFIAIIEPPSRDWFDMIHQAARVRLRPANFIAVEKKSGDTNNAFQDSSLRAAMEVGQSFVLIVMDAEAQASPSVLACADYRFKIPHPANSQIAATLRAVYGNVRIGKLPTAIGATAPASALLAAIRPSEFAGRAVARLYALDQRLSSSPSLADGPSLSDLAGYGAAKEWGLTLARDIQAYRAGELGWAELSSAALLHGEPGTGKTLFASALARQCKIPIVSTSVGKLFATTDGYLNSVVKALDQAFSEARAKAPCVLFLDEIDALPSRTAHRGDHNDGYFHVVVTRFLKLLDDERKGVIIVAATNLYSRLDPAITRPGRIELHFEITPPSVSELVGVFHHYIGDRLSAAQLASLADLACGATGADVAFRTKSAVAEARRAGRELTFDDVATQFLGEGDDDETLRRIATHEAGHAVVAMALGRRVEHASTVSVGKRGGGVLAEAIGNIGTRARIEEQVAILLAGRAAEALLLGESSSGACADLEAATNLVCSIHASLGLGAAITQRAPIEDARHALIDRSFREVVEAELRVLDARCRDILSTHLTRLQAIADSLSERRAISGDELRKLFNDT